MQATPIVADPSAAQPVARFELNRRERILAIIAGSAGNLIEWYNFYIYAFTALYFAPAFFPQGDRTAQLLNVAAIYAAGFVIRPVGGWFFGRFADRRGRRASMVASVLLMGAGSIMLAVLPTYASAGALAPLLLLIARVVQGFSLGGQYGATATYLSEVASDARRGFFASFQFVTLLGGQLAALSVLLLLQELLNEAELRAWGWRVMFAIGGLLALAILLLQRHMAETIDARTARTDAGSLRSLWVHARALGVVIILTAGGAVALYTFTTYMQKFLVNTAGLNVRAASIVMTAAIVIFMLLQPLIGALSDRIGRRRCLQLFAGLMTLSVVPLLHALTAAPTALLAFGYVLAALTILSFYTSISGLFKAELFPQHVRALGVGVAHSVSAAIFGGSTEYVALWFKRAGREEYFFWYVCLLCAAAFVTALVMREPRRASMRT